MKISKGMFFTRYRYPPSYLVEQLIFSCRQIVCQLSDKFYSQLSRVVTFQNIFDPSKKEYCIIRQVIRNILQFFLLIMYLHIFSGFKFFCNKIFTKYNLLSNNLKVKHSYLVIIDTKQKKTLHNLPTSYFHLKHPQGSSDGTRYHV